MIFVYRCDVIPFDMTGNNNDTGGPIDEKSYQWFGASISSSGDDGVIVVRLSFLAPTGAQGVKMCVRASGTFLK